MLLALALVVGCTPVAPDPSDDDTSPADSAADSGADSDAFAPVPSARKREIEGATTDFLNEGARTPEDVAGFLDRFAEFAVIGWDEAGVVSATYTDDVHLFVLMNRAPDAPPPSPPWQAAQAPVAPASAKATLLNMLGTCFDASTVRLAGQLSRHGYRVVEGTGSLDELRALHDLGLLHVNAHGGVGYRQPSDDGARGLHLKRPADGGPGVPARVGRVDRFVLMASDPVNEANDTRYAAELASGDLVRVLATHDRDPATGACGWVGRYAVDGLAFAARASFSEDSFVFVNACESFEPGFTRAMSQRGVGVYAGWTREVGDQVAVEAQTGLYQGLLGLGDAPPADFGSVMADLSAAEADRDSATGARLMWEVDRFDRPPFRLIPSLASASWDAGARELTLRGAFGDAPDAVLVDGAPVSDLVSWAEDQIRVGAERAPQSAQVVVAERRSNRWAWSQGGDLQDGVWTGTHGPLLLVNPGAQDRESGEADLYLTGLGDGQPAVRGTLYFTEPHYGGVHMNFHGGTPAVGPSTLVVDDLEVHGDQGFLVARARLELTLNPANGQLGGNIVMREISYATTYAGATATLAFTGFTPQ